MSNPKHLPPIEGNEAIAAFQLARRDTYETLDAIQPEGERDEGPLRRAASWFRQIDETCPCGRRLPNTRDAEWMHGDRWQCVCRRRYVVSVMTNTLYPWRRLYSFRRFVRGYRR